MIILGISGAVHDAAVALLRDGQLIAAVEEERFQRIKHAGFAGYHGSSSGLPWKSIEYCLKQAGIDWDGVDAVGYYFNPWQEYTASLRSHLRKVITSIPKAAFHAVQATTLLKDHLKAAALFRKKSKSPVKWHYVQHHSCHASSAFLVSPFEKSLIMILDGKGEKDASAFGIGEGNKFTLQHRIRFPHSLGMLYMELTKYLGFRAGDDEYKVMGLASFGEPEYLEEFKKIIQLSRDGGYKLDLSYFDPALTGPELLSDKFYRIFGPARGKREPVEKRHQNIAASLQAAMEESILKMLAGWQERTKLRNLCLAGGVAQNSVVNGKIMTSGLFDRVFIPPAAGDSGCAVGAALYVWNMLQDRPRVFEMHHAYWGPGYADEQMHKALDGALLTYEVLQNPAETTARLLKEGNIVAWYQGRMEFGPRALGSRSILADPTRSDMQDILNSRVKHREDFRPFAPSVIKEKAPEWFEGLTDSPFMQVVVEVKPDKRERVPAITHTDGTARPQTVEREVNPLYHEMISEFEKLTGVPLVVNTSFNIMGEPIVESPEQAIRCFYGTGIDCLVMGRYLLRKNAAAGK